MICKSPNNALERERGWQLRRGSRDVQVVDQVGSIRGRDAALRSTRALADRMRPHVLVSICLGVAAAGFLGLCAWVFLFSSYSTPTVLESDHGTLAGFTIGQTKEQLLLQTQDAARFSPASLSVPASSSAATRRQILIASESWNARSDDVVSECPRSKQCPGITLQFAGDRLSAVQVNCWTCP